MPYRRRYRKKNYKKKSVARTAKLALKLARVQLKNQEHKYLDNDDLVASIDTSGDIYDLSDCNKGNGVNNRDGNSIAPSSLSVRYMVGTAVLPEVIRVIVFIDLQNTLSSVLDILQPGPSTGSLSYAPYVKENRGKFIIKMDRTYSCVPDTTSSQIFGRFNCKLTHPIEYPAGDFNEPNTNALKIMFLSNNSETEDLPFGLYHARLSYTDN